MIKDETKNEIRLALKEKPILQQEFEKICKENADLNAFKERCKFNVSDIFKDIETENNFAKAKDIMKRLVDLSNSNRTLLGGTWHETVREAEDFLSKV